MAVTTLRMAAVEAAMLVKALASPPKEVYREKSLTARISTYFWVAPMARLRPCGS